MVCCVLPDLCRLQIDLCADIFAQAALSSLNEAELFLTSHDLLSPPNADVAMLTN